MAEDEVVLLHLVTPTKAHVVGAWLSRSRYCCGGLAKQCQREAPPMALQEMLIGAGIAWRSIKAF
jgi:hypothetical protein